MATIMEDYVYRRVKRFELAHSEPDEAVYVRSFSGRMTRLRWKILTRYVRVNTMKSGWCGHERDCCGCLTSTHASFEHKFNRTTITFRLSFNY